MKGPWQMLNQFMIVFEKTGIYVKIKSIVPLLFFIKQVLERIKAVKLETHEKILICFYQNLNCLYQRWTLP